MIPGLGVVDSSGIVSVSLDAGGNWYARGDIDVTNDDWVLRNGDLIASVDTPVTPGSTVLWSDDAFFQAFFMHTGDSFGNYIVGGMTNNPDTTADAVIVLNGEEIVCQEGDAIDLDGNGILDDNAFIEQIGFDDVHLSDDGVLLLVLLLRDDTNTTIGQAFVQMQLDVNGALGDPFCMAAINSTGETGEIIAVGSSVVADNNVTLSASNLPAFNFGIFLTSTTMGFVPGVSGQSNGNLCLGGGINRFIDIVMINANGVMELPVDLTAFPDGAVASPVMPGDVRFFQAWHRDIGGLGSNLTNGYEVEFE